MLKLAGVMMLWSLFDLSWLVLFLLLFVVGRRVVVSGEAGSSSRRSGWRSHSPYHPLDREGRKGEACLLIGQSYG